MQSDEKCYVRANPWSSVRRRDRELCGSRERRRYMIEMLTMTMQLLILWLAASPRYSCLMLVASCCIYQLHRWYIYIYTYMYIYMLYVDILPEDHRFWQIPTGRIQRFRKPAGMGTAWSSADEKSSWHHRQAGALGKKRRGVSRRIKYCIRSVAVFSGESTVDGCWYVFMLGFVPGI